jgi:hypothetical protein
LQGRCITSSRPPRELDADEIDDWDEEQVTATPFHQTVSIEVRDGAISIPTVTPPPQNFRLTRASLHRPIVQHYLNGAALVGVPQEWYPAYLSLEPQVYTIYQLANGILNASRREEIMLPVAAFSVNMLEDILAHVQERMDRPNRTREGAIGANDLYYLGSVGWMARVRGLFRDQTVAARYRTALARAYNCYQEVVQSAQTLRSDEGAWSDFETRIRMPNNMGSSLMTMDAHAAHITNENLVEGGGEGTRRYQMTPTIGEPTNRARVHHMSSA